jgi:signal transduction histidine kinase
VEDTGPGVPEEIQKRIFEPFFTTKKVSQGMGLGLSVAQSLARKYGGDLKLVSAKNPTRFDFIIPIRTQ